MTLRFRTSGGLLGAACAGGMVPTDMAIVKTTANFLAITPPIRYYFMLAGADESSSLPSEFSSGIAIQGHLLE